MEKGRKDGGKRDYGSGAGKKCRFGLWCRVKVRVTIRIRDRAKVRVSVKVSDMVSARQR